MAYHTKIKNKILGISIGITYLCFGIIKFFPNVSPAEELAENTISMLTFGLIPDQISLLVLASWETLVGIFIILNWQKKIVLNLAIIHILFTFSPLFLFSEQIFDFKTLSVTLLGQYIFKNIIILSSLIVLRIEAIKQSSVSSKKGIRVQISNNQLHLANKN
ncbi:doxx family protein [Maribacter sp. CXY002]|uniref:doxx family protein n=1 Tax=Maribacter luteocoastalis TaxID=3407671 RepID=UPI003B674FC9